MIVMTNLQLAMLALVISYCIVYLGIPKAIPIIQRFKLGQEIREEGPKSHYKKAGTPTMGGVVIQLGILVSVLLMALFIKKIDWFSLIMVLTYGVIGFIDDYIKVSQKHNLGLTVIQKLILQIVTAILFTIWAYTHSNIGSVMILPFLGAIDFGIFYIPITFIAIVAITNAVNLSDGLDGLCSGISSITMVFFLIIALQENEEITAIFGAAFIGACLGFLRYNSFPASIFMGDTGSMGLGGGLAAIAIKTHMEIFFLIAGFMFVLEALSVVIQVGYFKYSHGKRVFRMAPIHHHFELGGWKETKVVIVFWTWTAICVCFAFFLYSL